jgi:glutathione S-transferase
MAMTLLNLENPVFVTYAIASALMVLKVMGQGWMTVYRMMKSDSGLASPEDVQAGPLNKNPRPEQLDLNDYVDRSRRMHRNDLENIPAFWAAGLVFVTVGPPLLLAQMLMYGFVLARLAHGSPTRPGRCTKCGRPSTRSVRSRSSQWRFTRCSRSSSDPRR